MGVFHTLSAGKAGQFVPGRSGPTTRADALIVEGLDRVVALEATGAAIRARPMTVKVTPRIAVRRDRCCRDFRTMNTVYFGFTRVVSVCPRVVRRSEFLNSFVAQRFCHLEALTTNGMTKGIMTR
jgi:hypothetical protein